MDEERREPDVLKRGRKYHAEVQADWEATAEGDVTPEASVTKPSGGDGRIDILVDAGDGLVAVVELKSTRFDEMSEAAIRRNVRRHARQVWDYIDAQLDRGQQVCPGIVYPHRPIDPKKLELVESLLEEQGIPVVWNDESIDERKSRALEAGDA